MTYEEAEALAVLISVWNGSAVTLTCAADVMHELEEIQSDGEEPPEIQVVPFTSRGSGSLPGTTPATSSAAGPLTRR